MADDAAAPTGELSEPNKPRSGTDQGSAESPDAAAAEPESTAASDVEDAEDYDTEGDDAADNPDPKKRRTPMSPVLLATVIGLVTVVALGGLAGWLGYRAYQSHKAQQQRELFLQVGRQGALNLTTIDWHEADTDVQRILDSATGTFYDDFSKRSQPFVEVVKQAQSKSVGTIAESGLESVSGSEAQVLVAVSVKTSNAGAPQQDPRGWRMRLSVQKVGDEAKISNVAFVP